jgi:hypothetical protein
MLRFADISRGIHIMLRNIGIGGVLLLLAGSTARAQDKYFAVIFGQEDGRNRFCEAHSFATFVRIRLEPTGPEVVDRATISWLPAAGPVKLFKRAEKGRNYTLEESFALLKPGHSVAQWGPFEIKEELFDRAKKQAAFLSGGGVLYKAVDPFSRPAGVAINCEHAICDIGLRAGESILRTGTAHGHHGSYLVAMHLRDWMIEPAVAHDWVARPLKLDQYAIVKGSWDYQGPGRMEPPNIAVATTEPNADKAAHQKTEKKVDPPTVAGAGR